MRRFTSFLAAIMVLSLSACNGEVTNSPSGVVQQLPPPVTTPSAPTNLTAVSTTAKQVQLSWTGSDGAMGYKVYRDNQHIGTIYQTTFTDTGVTAGAIHSYIVCAANYAGDSPSAHLDVTIPKLLVTSAGTAHTATDGTYLYAAVEKQDKIHIAKYDENYNLIFEIPATPEFGHFSNKLIAPETSDFIFLFTTKRDPGEFFSADRRSTMGQIFLVRVNKNTQTAELPIPLSAPRHSLIVATLAGNNFYMAYGSSSQKLQKISLDGVILKDINYSAGYVEEIVSDGNYIYTPGRSQGGAHNRIWYSKLDMDLNYIEQYQQRPTYATQGSTDNMYSAVMTVNGLLISGILYPDNSNNPDEPVLLKVDTSTGTFSKLVMAEIKAMSPMRTDQDGNIFGEVSTTGFSTYGLRKISPTGKIIWTSPLVGNNIDEMTIFKGKIYITYSEDDLADPKSFKPHTINVFDANTGARLQ